MRKWLEGKFNSVKHRIMFAFSLALISVFTFIGVYLDVLLTESKHHHIERHFNAQSKVFTACLNGASDSQRLMECSYLWREISAANNLYFYDIDKNLIWKFEPEPQAVLLAETFFMRPTAKNYITEFVFTSERHFIYHKVLADKKTILLSRHLAPFNQEVILHRWYLAIALFLNALLLFICFIWVLHRGLKPLDNMVFDLDEIATGGADRLKKDYATEFVAMRDSLNNLLNTERLQRERYRNTLADLAHSLKTPLAVLQGAAGENLDYASYLAVASEQIRRMDQIIQYQLTRAVKSIGDGAKNNSVKVTPIIERIFSALAKVYCEKEVRILLNLESAVEINADERDLMEMLGNMLENAFKYCRSEVSASLYEDSDNVFIIIEDDGPGVSQDLRHIILERGQRADTSSAPGQGIGLSVSVDILSSYNCRLEVDDSFSLGGAKFSITFPKS